MEQSMIWSCPYWNCQFVSLVSRSNILKKEVVMLFFHREMSRLNHRFSEWLIIVTKLLVENIKKENILKVLFFQYCDKPFMCNKWHLFFFVFLQGVILSLIRILSSLRAVLMFILLVIRVNTRLVCYKVLCNY